MYQVDFRPAALRELEKLGKRMSLAVYEELEAAIDGLAREPHPHSCRKVANTPYLRIKVAQTYRIIYQVVAMEQKVMVVRVAKRSESTYKRLS